jgi:hypothetical protein
LVVHHFEKLARPRFNGQQMPGFGEHSRPWPSPHPNARTTCATNSSTHPFPGSAPK